MFVSHLSLGKHRRIGSGTLKPLIKNDMGFAYNLYLHVGYSRVCLHIASFRWIHVVLGVWQIQVLLFETFQDFSKTFSVHNWLNLGM